MGRWRAELAIQMRILRCIEETIQHARNLARRAEALRIVAPKLRAKGADAAVELFLTEDAVAPSSMLSPQIRGTSTSMTSRVARRFEAVFFANASPVGREDLARVVGQGGIGRDADRRYPRRIDLPEHELPRP